MTDIVLFGVTGDLSRQKLLPSLARLYKNGTLTGAFFAYGRKPYAADEFASFISENSKSESGGFAKAWTYVQGELDDVSRFKKLANALRRDAVIYMSLPPTFQLSTAKMLIDSGVLSKKNGRKIAFEKPFGSDLAGAKKLNAYLAVHLDEKQILRVDHYAGKQALLELEDVAKFGFLDPLLNVKNVKKVVMRITERKTVEGRGAFYDSVGAVTDVVQNHVLHAVGTILALPYACRTDFSRWRADAISGISLSGKPVLGQYRGFSEEPGVAKGSLTETYYFLENKFKGSGLLGKRWNGVKIVLEGGKALKENDASLEVHFAPHMKFERQPVSGAVKTKKVVHNVLRIPINGFGTKDAYDAIFEAAVNGDHEQFANFKQVVAGWKYVEAVKRSAKRQAVKIYKQNSL